MASSAIIGIADQKPDMFADSRFRAAGFGHARLMLPWDVMDDPRELERADRWLAEARAAGVRPLVTFTKARGDRGRILPKTEQLLAQFKGLRERFPWVVEYSTWNEANYRGQPTYSRPRTVARYYRALRRECPRCTVLAADLLDSKNMVSWVRTFQRAATRDRAAGRRIPWGLHNYIDVNRFRTKGTAALLKETRGPIWLTETGGIVRRTGTSKTPLPEGVGHAARATDFLFGKLLPLDRRLQRVYLYHWNAHRGVPWDSALVDPDGASRPAFSVALKWQRRFAARRTPSSPIR